MWLMGKGVKRIHHYLYFDHYYPGKTEQERMLIEHHVGELLQLSGTPKGAANIKQNTA